jgi:hypothetical protein
MTTETENDCWHRCACKCSCFQHIAGDGARGTPVRTWAACFRCGAAWLEGARKHGPR